MLNNILFQRKNHYHIFLKDFIDGHCIIFSIFFWLVTFHEAIWQLKNYKSYTLCTLILSNPPHPIIRSKLILTQNELWVQKCCCAIFKVFYLCLWQPKDAIKILVYCILWYLLYITFFEQKWFTLNMFSPLFIIKLKHLNVQQFCDGFWSYFLFIWQVD
jgi:hypothetical protein